MKSGTPNSRRASSGSGGGGTSTRPSTASSSLDQGALRRACRDSDRSNYDHLHSYD